MSHSPINLPLYISSVNKNVPLSQDQIQFIKDLLKDDDSFLFSQSKLNERIKQTLNKTDIQIPFRILKIKTTNHLVANDAYYLIEKDLLGAGQTNKIKTIRDLDTGEKFALKIIPDSEDSENQAGETLGNYQFKILEKIQEAYGAVIRKKTPGENTKENRTAKRYMIINLAKGEPLQYLLQEYIEQRIYFSYLELIDICLLVARAVKKLHQGEVLHCDIKLENMIYDMRTNTLKLVSFGSALEIKHAATNTQSLGTPSYHAPEIRDGHQPKYSQGSDIYALGESFKRMWGFATFHDNKEESVLNERTYQELSPELQKHLSSLIYKMTTEKPEDRATIDDVCDALEEIKRVNREALLLANPLQGS